MTLSAGLTEFKARCAEIDINENVELKRMTTFGIGGPADVLVKPKTADEVRLVLQTCDALSLPLFYLGGGSNLLVADAGIRGVVMKLDGELAHIEVSDDGNEIVVGAGASFPKLTKVALGLGWESAVGWMGTPGLVGGALIMNAGTRDGCIGEVVVEVSAATAEKQITFDRSECGFAYRNSNFPRSAVLTTAHLRCDDRRSDSPSELQKRAKELLKKRHASQPKLRSAGSIFKNPPGDYAGRLIEAVGLKGKTVGGAQISQVHANFIVNTGDATAADVLQLAAMAQDAVSAQCNVDLEWEVKRVGDFASSDGGDDV